MAAADVSALLDIASTPDLTPVTPSSPSPEPDTETADSALPEAAPEQPEGQQSDESSGDVQDDTPGEEKPIDGRTNPVQIRSALKRFRDSAPENAGPARELNNGYGRYLAYKDSFPTVDEARSAKALLDAVGGDTGLATLQEQVKSLGETDSLLYSGDPRVLDNLIDDMRSEGKLDAFGKLASPFLDKLRSVDEKAYLAALKPHFFQQLVNVGVPNVLQSIQKALSSEKPDLETARGWIAEFNNWFDNLRNGVETAAKAGLDPERQAFQQERTKWESERTDTFKREVASSNVSHTLRSLGSALKPYMKLPYFKNFSDASKKDLASGLFQQAISELTADKSYQSQMDAFFSQKAPDRKSIEQYHAAKLDSMSQRIVKSMLETRYPNYARGAKATPTSVKPAAAKPGAAGQQPTAGKPVFVNARPKYEDLDMDKDPNKYLFISGRGYRKADGRFVTWNPRYK